MGPFYDTTRADDRIRDRRHARRHPMSLFRLRWMRHLKKVRSARAARAAGPGTPWTAMMRLLRLSRLFTDPRADAELMPLRTLLRHDMADIPEGLLAAMERFENRVARNPQKTQDIRMCQERMLELTTASMNTEAHFEKLTGHLLADMPVQSQKKSSAGTRGLQWQERHAGPRAPRRRLRARPVMVTCVAMICLLMVASHDTDPLSRAVAEVAASESLFLGGLGQTTRGASLPRREQRIPTARMVLEHIDEARTSILGFHTGYELSRLQEAADLIDEINSSATALEPGSAAMYRLHVEVLNLLQERGNTVATPPFNLEEDGG